MARRRRISPARLRALVTLLLLPICAAAPAGAAVEVETPESPEALQDECDGINPDARCTFPPIAGAPDPGPQQPAALPKLVAWTSGVDPNPFHRFRGGIFVARIDGSDQRKVVRFENGNLEIAPHGLNEPDDHPSFSPDGRQLVFTSNRADRNRWHIYKMNVNGTGVVRLTSIAQLDTEPVFSPDGTKIAFASNRLGSLDIWVMNADGSNQKFLTGSFPAAEIEPAWSPDGSTIAFTKVQEEGEKDVFVVNATTGFGVRQVTNVPKEDHDATFGPTGQELVITSERPPTSVPFGNVHKIRLSDGASLGDLTTDLALGAGDPAWSFDGKKIAFFKAFLPLTIGPQQLFVMNADGSGKVHIPGEGTVNVHPAIGRLVDDDKDGVPNYLESGSIGDARLRVRRVVRTRRAELVRFGWRHPERWKRLSDVELFIVGPKRAIGAIRFVERPQTFALWDPVRGHWGRARRRGRGKLQQGLVTLDLRRTRVVKTSKKTIDLVLALRFKRRAAGRSGRRYRFETYADDESGKSQRERLRSVRIVP